MSKSLTVNRRDQATRNAFFKEGNHQPTGGGGGPARPAIHAFVDFKIWKQCGRLIAKLFYPRLNLDGKFLRNVTCPFNIQAVQSSPNCRSIIRHDFKKQWSIVGSVSKAWRTIESWVILHGHVSCSLYTTTSYQRKKAGYSGHVSMIRVRRVLMVLLLSRIISLNSRKTAMSSSDRRSVAAAAMEKWNNKKERWNHKKKFISEADADAEL